MTTPDGSVGAIVAAAPLDEHIEALQWEPLLRQPVVARVLAAVAPAEEIAAVALIVAPHRLERARRLARRISRSLRVVVGEGVWREDIHSALAVLPASLEWIALLDGTRPLLTRDAIASGLAAARATGAATAASPITETIKRTDAAMRVVATLDRARLVTAHAPQIVRRDLLAAACARAEAGNVLGALIAGGVAVMTFPAGDASLAIGTADDLAVAARLLAQTPKVPPMPTPS
jgi:2-C-methyl-D-erythritol 4-phosphate cytidylyltransferase